MVIEETARGTSSLGRRLLEVAWGFLPLGWVAFGGPQAHIALLQDHFVFRRKWLDEQRFAELLGMGQGLPGPTSTQMVVAVGTVRAGPLGGMSWGAPMRPTGISVNQGLNITVGMTFDQGAPDSRAMTIEIVGAGVDFIG